MSISNLCTRRLNMIFLQERLSPGARTAATASIEGCNSNIGNDVSGLTGTSVSPSICKPRPPFLPSEDMILAGDETLEVIKDGTREPVNEGDRAL